MVVQKVIRSLSRTASSNVSTSVIVVIRGWFWRTQAMNLFMLARPGP